MREPRFHLVHDRSIGRGEGERVEIRNSSPPKCSDIERARLGRIFVSRGIEKEEEHGFVGVVVAMKGHVDRFADGHLDAELFAQFTHESITRVFAHFDFAAGEFPHPCEVRADLALRQ